MQMDLWYALLLIVVQVWDAVNDPLIGSIVDADRRQYKRNKFLAYIWTGSIGLIVGGACCFLPFPNASVWAKAIIFIAGYVVWDAFYTVANVPYGSLLSLISNDVKDRASLSAWRSVGSIFGNMLPMVILPFIIYDKDDNLIGERVFIAALIMGALGFLCFQFMIRNTEIRVETNVALNEDAPKFNVFKAFGNFVKNRPAVGATLAAMGMFIGMQGAATAVTVIFQSYYNNVKISGIVATFRGKLWFAKVGLKIKKAMGGNGDGKKKEAMGFELSEDMMQMMGGFTVLRLTSLIGMMNITFTKEDLLKMNKQLNRIRKPKK